jgi:hypothetical protein
MKDENVIAFEKCKDELLDKIFEFYGKAHNVNCNDYFVSSYQDKITESISKLMEIEKLLR